MSIDKNPTLVSSQRLQTVALVQKQRLSKARLQVAGIRYDMTEAEVIKRLGKPQQRMYTETEQCFGGPTSTLTYPELEINLGADRKNTLRTYSVKTTGTKFATVDGVRIGDTRQKVFNTYGRADETALEYRPGFTYISYPASKDGLVYLEFVLKDGCVVELGYNATIC
ncbi:MAG: hypothetical protein VKL59_13310 [Nostocaceae cyanobacterium]|nr:hypothetical protein [Nostocaceae cyanobacterium]